MKCGEIRLFLHLDSCRGAFCDSDLCFSFVTPRSRADDEDDVQNDDGDEGDDNDDDDGE
jgi:hypothetical protein